MSTQNQSQETQQLASCPFPERRRRTRKEHRDTKAFVSGTPGLKRKSNKEYQSTDTRAGNSCDPLNQCMRKQSSAVPAMAATTSASPASVTSAITEASSTQQTQPQDEILDRVGVARLLALTPEQVDERVRTRAGKGRIPHHTLGAKTIRFIRSEVLEWLIQQPQNTKRRYRLSPGARKSLVLRNRQRRTQNAI